MLRCAFLAYLTALAADPPGALVRTKLQVPASLKTGVFAQDRLLTVPPGFQISLVAMAGGARFMAVAPNGDVLVSQPGAGKVTLLRPDASGSAAKQFTYVSGLTNPHGIVFHAIGGTTYVYLAESNQIDRFVYVTGDTAAHDKQVIVSGLPDASTVSGYAHPFKHIAIDTQHNLYVSLGSTCNVCTADMASTPVRAAVYIHNADGTAGRLFARGLRNAEGLAILPGGNQLWAVVNNRDDQPYGIQDASGNYGKVVAAYVDNHPPDLFTAVRDGGNYGWPYCDSSPDNGLDRMPFDLDYDMNRDGHVNCAAMDVPDKGIQAHSAPLGLSFLQGTGFAAPYRNGAVAGLHGSWNRTVKTGYKVVWFGWNNGPGAATDLVTGWLDDASQTSWGRPVDAVPDSSGGLLISDDSAGAIYRLTYAPGAVSAANGYALVAPESLGSVFGTGLASQTATASSPDWPATLAGVSLTIQDSAGVSRPAPLSYVSPSQINFEIPLGTAAGPATVSLASGPLGGTYVAAVAPALFSANGDGKGAAAALGTRVVIPSGIQSALAVFDCPKGAGSCVTVPIALGVDTPIYISFYGTGIRNRSSLGSVHVTVGGVDAPVLYAGAQGAWPGLDQVNVALPLALRGAGEVDVVLTVDGQNSNTVRIAVQ